MLERLGIKRNELTITNSICCSPPSLGWTDHPARYPEAISAIRQCEPYLIETLGRQLPKVIVALRNVAMRQTINLHIPPNIPHLHTSVPNPNYAIPPSPPSP